MNTHPPTRFNTKLFIHSFIPFHLFIYLLVKIRISKVHWARGEGGHLHHHHQQQQQHLNGIKRSRTHASRQAGTHAHLVLFWARCSVVPSCAVCKSMMMMEDYSVHCKKEKGPHSFNGRMDGRTDGRTECMAPSRTSERIKQPTSKRPTTKLQRRRWRPVATSS